jgi:hypothetical protein
VSDSFFYVLREQYNLSQLESSQSECVATQIGKSTTARAQLRRQQGLPTKAAEG